MAYPGLSTIIPQVNEAPQSHPAIMHSDEIETSIMLHLREQCVQMDKAVREYPIYPAHFDNAPVRWDTVSSTGVFGDATAATADKGERVVEHVVGVARGIIEQWKAAVL